MGALGLFLGLVSLKYRVCFWYWYQFGYCYKTRNPETWYNGLLAKLAQIGIEGSVFDILRSYLSDRSQAVVVDGQKSDMLDVKAGLPQGSRLGPLLCRQQLGVLAPGSAQP